MSRARLTYNEEKNLFVFECPIYLNDIARAIPNRRWSPKHKAWLAPALRLNAQYFREILINVDHSPEAKAKIEEQESAKPILRNGFPSWFKFKTEPWKFQRDRLNHLYGQRIGGLYMDPGTGKTKLWLDIVAALRAEGKIDQALVNCPYSVFRDWKKGIEEHGALPMAVFEMDPKKQTQFDDWVTFRHDFKIMLVGTEAMSVGRAPDMVRRYLSVARTAWLLDEAHDYKSYKAARSINVVQMAPLAEYRHVATGTEISHGPLDLFMQFEFLDPEIIGIGDFISFRNRYAVMGGFQDKQIVGYQKIDELMEIVAPYVVTAKKTEVFPDLPPKVYSLREVKMAPEQEAMYKKFKKDVNIEVGDKTLSIDNILERLLRLSEITSGYWSSEIPCPPDWPANQEWKPQYERHELPDPKLDEAIRIAESNDLPTIIWTPYTYQLTRVVRVFRDKFGPDSVVEMHGGVDREARGAGIDRFTNGGARFFIANQQTGGVGINLQRAQIEIFLANSYRFTHRVQSEDRAWRAGQKNRVTIYDIICGKTWDERVLTNLQNKRDIADYVRERISKGMPVLDIEG